ncbi:MAG: glycosyltransferase family 4 protein [Pseudomonadota bacterium]
MIVRSSMRAWRPGVIHETYYSDRSSAPKGCPVVITVHDMIPELFASEFSWKDSTSRLKRIAVERAEHIICVSQSTRRDLIELFSVPESKISVVYHGFDRFESGVGEGVSEGLKRPYLLYVGYRNGYKNFLGLLQAVSGSSRLKHDFNIIAFGGGAFTSDENALISRLGFRRGQVRQVSGGDAVLGTLYENARAFVYPSVYEGFGLPPLEAMAHSCPVVSSRTSSMPEVGGEAGIFFDPASSAEMAASIERVV